MQRSWRWTPVLGALLWAAAPAAHADLAGYLARPEPQYRWEKTAEKSEGLVTVTDLKLRSQVWRGIPWDHTLKVFRPAILKYPTMAVLLITGGNPGTDDVQIGTMLAGAFQAPVAILFNIPNQPLFDGKNEDDLIAHTFAEYLKSGEEDWPVLFPMTKSAVKAMDALQALSEKEWKQKLERFIVTGASKRGWTTYLTGASDARVKAIVPIVFDNLKFQAQMPRQLRLWGRYSEQIEEYTRRGLQQQMDSERGRKLVSLVDPWFYRQRLNMPKLLIHGANDPYWATDATSLYWNDLPGEKALLHVPNAGHDIRDLGRVTATATAFVHSVAAEQAFPRVSHENGGSGTKRRLRLKSNVKPQEARLWVARSETMDFRSAKWESTPMQPDGEGFADEISVPEKGGIAWYGEAVFAGPLGTYTLCTPVQVASAS